MDFEKLDTGIQALCTAATALGMKIDADTLRAKVKPEKYPECSAYIRAFAKAAGLNSRIVHTTMEELPHIPIPSLACLKNGNYVVVGQQSGNRLIIFDPKLQKPAAVPKEDFAVAWTGELTIISRPFSWQLFKAKYQLNWFLPIMLRFKRLFAEVMTASVFLQIFGLATPLFTQVIIDKVIVHQGLSTLNVLAVTLIIIALFQSGMTVLRTYVLAHTTTKLDTVLGTRLFRHLTALPFTYFENTRVGNLMIMVSALTKVREFLTGSTLTAILDGVFTLIFLAIMFYYSTPLTLIALAVVPVYFLQSMITTPIYRRRLEKNMAALSDNNAFLVEAVSGMPTIKALAVEPQFNAKWERLLARYVYTTFHTTAFTLVFGHVGDLFNKIASLAILWYGGYMVIHGIGGFTLGKLIAFQMMAGQASGTLLRIATMWPNVQQAGFNMEMLGNILNRRPETLNRAQSSQGKTCTGDIVLENVSFRYGQQPNPVLSEINLHFPAGTKTGVVGRSGSGKSTLAKLLQCLYVPESGKIVLDGEDIAAADPLWLRQQIGVVLQENYLFNGSVRDNIAITRPSASMEEIIQVARLAGAHDFILELPEGYDTPVGERGNSLSGGQRQRIAIARALLTNPRILIFDEATSALDYESERIIMRHLDAISKGRTVIMIAHRLSTIRRADNIVVIDEGHVVEQGNHDSLMNTQGLYHHLYMLQEGEKHV